MAGWPRRCFERLGDAGARGVSTRICCRRYDSDRIDNLPVGESLVTVTSTSTSFSSRQYVNASYVDEPVLLIDRTAAGSVGAGTDERFYYHRNQQYSITALTDNSGTPVERYAYTAYGEPTILDGAGTTTRTSSFINNPYAYTAQEYDAESGLYHFNARMYEGRKGRFLSHDPIRYPDGANTYAGWFAIARIDPTGMDSIPFHFAAFIPKRFGLWIDEPGSAFAEFRGDNGDFNQPGRNCL